MAHAPDRAITAFSMRYRAAFNDTISLIQQHGRFAIRDFRTDQGSAVEIAEQILGVRDVVAPERELVGG
jgi:hypothetical protein